MIDKMGRKIPDTPKNYGKLVKGLVSPLIEDESPKEIFFDKHFASKSDTEVLQEILDSISPEIKFSQVDSITDPRVDLADFIAGATLRMLRANDETFYNIILPKIAWEESRKWNELQ